MDLSSPETSQAIAKAIGYYPQPDGKALLLKATLNNVIIQGEVKLN